MVIHLVSSFRQWNGNFEFLEKIVETVHQNNGELARNWLDLVAAKVKNDTLIKENWKQVVQENIEAIARCDAVIVEASDYGFLDGFQMATALRYDKPILVVGRISLDDWAISGLKSESVIIEQYQNKEELEQLVVNFLSSDMVAAQPEVKTALGPQLYEAVRSAATRAGVSESQALRDLARAGLEATTTSGK